MMEDAFATSLEERIQREYVARGDELGWRLLYSPKSVLNGARVAFIGINPAGSYRPADHAEFATPTGSAYEVESWGDGMPPGESCLQRQVLRLFSMIGERPEDVLAGNLVPFRSPRWKKLRDRKQALLFGIGIWREIIEKTKPKIVIAMGSDVRRALIALLQARNVKRISLAWGNVGAIYGDTSYGVLIGIPHLSTHKIMSRAQSVAVIGELLESI